MLHGGLVDIFFSDTLPVLNKSMCLNRRNRFESCNLCGKICGSDSIKFSDGLPEINNKNCISCGLCAYICPSEAIKLRDYQVLRNILADNLLKCLKTGGAYCIKSFSAAFLAALIVIKPDINFIMPCENCDINSRVNNDNLEIAVKFLDSLKINHDINIIRDKNFESELSRRDLIKNFLTWSRNKSNNLIENFIWHDKNNSFNARKFLCDKLINYNGQIDSGIFYNFDVLESCDLCGLCEGLCPSGALKIVKSGGKAILKFYAEKCSGCDLCVRKCPRNAIKLCKNFSWPINENIKREIIMTRCRHCGMYFIKSEPDQDLCISCFRS